jgi:hypothetical protein
MTIACTGILWERLLFIAKEACPVDLTDNQLKAGKTLNDGIGLIRGTRWSVPVFSCVMWKQPSKCCSSPPYPESLLRGAA